MVTGRVMHRTPPLPAMSRRRDTRLIRTLDGADATNMPRLLSLRSARFGATVAMSLTLAGCGSSMGNRPLNAAQLASAGSAICSRAATEERALEAEQNARKVKSLEPAIPRIEAISKREVADLAKLTAPPDEQASYRVLLSDTSQLTELLGALRSALADGGSPPSELLAHGRELATRVAAIDGPIGMGVCSSSASN